MQVEVPEGVYPGDAMNIMVGDQEFTITVPDGVEPGMLMEVDLPVDEGADPGGPSEEPQTEPVIVEVPPGLGPGDAFTVETAWGGVFEIAVPDGVGPGDQIQVDLPTQAAHEGVPQEPAEPPPPPPATTPWELVGRRAALCGLIAKAILNGRKGTVRSYNPDKDRLVVTIDGMHPDVAVAFRNLKELPPSDAVMHLPDTEPPEAPPAGVHYVRGSLLLRLHTLSLPWVGALWPDGRCGACMGCCRGARAFALRRCPAPPSAPGCAHFLTMSLRL